MSLNGVFTLIQLRPQLSTQNLITNGYNDIMQKCSHCTKTDTNIGCCTYTTSVSPSLCVILGQCECTIIFEQSIKPEAPPPRPRTSQIRWGFIVQTFSDGVHLDAVLVLLHDGLHLVQVEEARPVIVPHLEQTVEQRLPPRRQHLLTGLRGQRFV